MNEVPTYTPPEGVHGPTLGRDLPDGCERLRASIYPNFRDEWWDGPGVTNDCLYWWRTVPLKVGDTVQLTATDLRAGDGGGCDGTSDGTTREEAAMNETKTEWRDCADPDELAAAVAAGVEVRAMGRAGDFPTANQTADRFAGSLRAGITYQLPASWSWRPEPTPEPDDLRERIARAAAGGYMRVPIGARDGMYLGPPWLDVADAVLAVLPTPLPVPPWPGAVLSGLVDEDGVPTWLAQAGQVRGEQVRACTSVPWLPNTSYGEDEWVEVRAPRAVPAALVTVTIPAETAHALLRYIEDGDYDTDYVIDRLADLLIAAMDGDQ